MSGLNCPHCGWSMQITKDWVDVDGYHGLFTCRYATCEVSVSVTSDLLWAYENNKIKIIWCLNEKKNSTYKNKKKSTYI